MSEETYFLVTPDLTLEGASLSYSSKPFSLSNNVSEELFTSSYNNNSSREFYILNLTSSGNCEGGRNVIWKFLDSNKALVPCLFSVIGIIGQVIALLLLYEGGRSMAGRSVFYLLLTMIILADLVGQFLTAPFPIAMYIYSRWVGGWTTCKIHGFMMALVGLVQVFLVSIMSLERFMGISCSFYKREVFQSKSNACKLVITVIILSALYCLLPFIHVGEYVLQHPGSWCFLNLHVCSDLHWKHRVFTNLYAFIFLFNIVIVVVLNIYVVGSLLKMRLARPPKVQGSTPPSIHSEKEVQMVIVLVIITIVFLMSWAPLNLLLFFNQLFPHSGHMIDLYAIRMVSLNQISDPWAYIICRKFFASKMWKWLKGTVADQSANLHSVISNRRRSSATSNHSVHALRKNSRSASISSQQHDMVTSHAKKKPFCPFKQTVKEEKNEGNSSISEKTSLIVHQQKNPLPEPKDDQDTLQKNISQVPIPVLIRDESYLDKENIPTLKKTKRLSANSHSIPNSPTKHLNSSQTNGRSSSWTCSEDITLNEVV